MGQITREENEAYWEKRLQEMKREDAAIVAAGYSFKRCINPQTGQVYWGVYTPNGQPTSPKAALEAIGYKPE